MSPSYKYKFLTVAYQTVHNQAPSRLSNLFLPTLSSMYVLATVAFFQFLIFVRSFLTKLAFAASFLSEKVFVLWISG